MTRKLAVGDKAPEFNLEQDGDGAATLASFAGKKLVLYFYPKDDTPGCTKEAIDFNRLKPQFSRAETEIVGVSPDSGKSHDKFKAKHKLGLTLLSDEAKETLEAYGVWAEKSMYGRTYMGVVRTTFLIGPDGKIARIWHKVKVPNHAEEVLQAAKDL